MTGFWGGSRPEPQNKITTKPIEYKDNGGSEVAYYPLM